MGKVITIVSKAEIVVYWDDERLARIRANLAKIAKLMEELKDA